MFKKEAIIMVSFFVALIGLGIVLSFIVPMIKGFGSCENKIISTYPSPKGDYKAIIFSRDCGATTDFNTQISILDKGEELADDGGNTFIADTDHGAVPAASWGGPDVNVIWSGESNLLISYDPKTRVFKKEHIVHGVKIAFPGVASQQAHPADAAEPRR